MSFNKNKLNKKFLNNNSIIMLGDVGSNKKNNLNILRLIAAVLVIGSHSVPLTAGPSSMDLLAQMTRGSLSFGSLAVGIFLLMSGYLIAGSVERRRNFYNYFSARCFRIFPQLFFVVFCCAFVVGPLFSKLSPKIYFFKVETWLYFLNGILIMRHNLPGVFINNAYPNVVNGSLWILPIEFSCYLLAYILFRVYQKKSKYFLLILFLVFSCTAVIFIVVHPSILFTLVSRPVLLFLIGMCAYIYCKQIRINKYIFVVFVINFILLIYLKLDLFAMLVCFPYIFFYIAFAAKYKIFVQPRIRENSYGLYLWGWPIGQMLCQIASNNLKWWMLLLLTLPLAYMLGLLGAKVSDILLTAIRKEMHIERK
ncbi:acyltransferase [Alkalibaculum bacchi]|uniref:acyltransferase family protein n=1 Tax=Alkalibaculum bacchi TaxID=645887 RepID=UPI0026EFD890|nr:acyltransferase [Alkalibaculum bacchi]